MDTDLALNISILETAVVFLLLLYILAEVGDLYFKHRIRTLEEVDSPEADNEIARISDLRNGALCRPWWKFWFYVDAMTMGDWTPLAPKWAVESHNDEKYEAYIHDGGDC